MTIERVEKMDRPSGSGRFFPRSNDTLPDLHCLLITRPAPTAVTKVHPAEGLLCGDP